MYLCTDLIEYIQQNHEKSGLTAKYVEYRFNSYHDYVASDTDLLTDTEKLCSIIDRNQFDKLMCDPVSGAFLDVNP